MSDFKSVKYSCPHCGSTVCSSYSGEYATCECGKFSVDQTETYVRFIGGIPKEVDSGDNA